MVRLEQGRQEKKLIGAVEHWFRGDVNNDEFLEDAAFYGLEVEEPLAVPDYEVWPENWDSVLMFVRVQTQWRTSGQGGVIGLDYNVVLGLLPLYAVPEPAQLVEDIRVMESRAVELINESAAKRAKEADRKARSRRR